MITAKEKEVLHASWTGLSEFIKQIVPLVIASGVIFVNYQAIKHGADIKTVIKDVNSMTAADKAEAARKAVLATEMAVRAAELETKQAATVEASTIARSTNDRIMSLEKQILELINQNKPKEPPP